MPSGKQERGVSNQEEEEEGGGEGRAGFGEDHDRHRAGGCAAEDASGAGAAVAFEETAD